jgi:hypothetical protein
MEVLIDELQGMRKEMDVLFIIRALLEHFLGNTDNNPRVVSLGVKI